MVKEIGKVEQSYKSVVSALERAKEDCSSDDIKKVSKIVKSLIHEKLDIKELKKIHTTIKSRIRVISTSRTPSPLSDSPASSPASPTQSVDNLSELADRVDQIIHEDCPERIASLFEKDDMTEFRAAIAKEKDPRLLYEIAIACAKKQPLKTAQYLELFKVKFDEQMLMQLARFSKSEEELKTFIRKGLKSQEQLYFLLTDLASTNPRLVINFLKNNLEKKPIEDKTHLKSILKHCARQDGLYVALHIRLLREFGLGTSSTEDQPFLIEIAKLCAKQNGATANYVDNFEIQDLKDKMEIAKLCAKNDGLACAEYISNFGLDQRDEGIQAFLVEIAKLCANQNGAVAQYIENFEIKDPKERIEVAKICAKNDGGSFAKYFHLFQIEEPEVVLELAKLAATSLQPVDTLFIENLENFMIQDPIELFELAKLCAKSNLIRLAENLEKFKIEDEKKRIELALIYAESNPETLLRKFSKSESEKEQDALSEINDQDALFEIAQTCASVNGYVTAIGIKSFKITDPARKYEIARCCIEQDGKAISCLRYFELPREPEAENSAFLELVKLAAQKEPEITFFTLDHLSIQDERERAIIAELCIRANPKVPIDGLEEFEIQDPGLLSHLAEVAAEADPSSFMENMEKFILPNEKKRELARYCAEKEGASTARYIYQFNLESSDAFEVAKICAANGWNPKVEEFAWFSIQDQAKIIEILEIAILNGSFTYPANITSFELPGEVEERLYFLAFCSNFLNNSLQGDVQKEFDQKIYVQIKAYIESENTMDIHGEISSLKSILGLSSENKKEYCILYLAAKLLGFRIEDERSIQALKKVCECRNGPLALSLALKLSQFFQGGSAYFEAIENAGTLKIEDHFLLPLLVPSSWAQGEEEKKLLLSIRENLDAGAIKKTLAGSGSSIEQAWLKTCQLLDENSDISPLQKLQLLLIISTHLNPKDPKKDLLSRLNSLEVIVASKRGDLIEMISSLQTAVDSFDEKLNALAPHLLELKKNKIEQGEVEKKIKLLQNIKAQARLDFRSDEKGSALLGLEKIRDAYLARQQNGEDSAELKEKIELVNDQIRKQEGFIDDWIQSRHPEFETGIQELEGEKAKLSEKAAFLSKFQLSIKKREKEVGKLEKSLDSKLTEKEDVEARLKDVKARLSEEKGDSAKEKLEARLQRLKSEITLLKTQIEDLQNSIRNESEIEKLEIGLKTKIAEELFKGIKTILHDDPYLDLSSVKDLEESFLKTLNSMRYPNAWKVYQIRLERTGDKELQHAFQRFIIGVLSGSFKQDRYSTDKSSHIAQIALKYPKIWLEWQKDNPEERIEIAGKPYQIINTDNWEDLLLCGTDMEGSCQHVAGNPEFNKCLLGYTNDGKNRMIAIKDPTTNKIVARTIAKMLWSEKEQRPVLYLEVVYPHKVSDEMREMLTKYAIKEAKRLDCTLYSKENFTNDLPKNEDRLQSLKSKKAPFEYSDSTGGVMANGAFTVQSGFLVSPRD